MREETDGERATIGLGLAAGKSFPSPFAHERGLAKGSWIYPLIVAIVWINQSLISFSEGEPAGGA
eukprot:3861769-Prorocentrum_lima.AAC.1